ncbi:hypothetical protein ABFS83_14G181100 [Erythranthe nasuta]
MAFPVTLLLVSLVSIGFTESSAQGDVHVSLFNNITMAGVITCPNASLANVKTFSTIPEAKVDVVCKFLFLKRVMKSTTANNEGVYSFSFSMSDILLNKLNLCYLNVTIPPNSCTFRPPGGAIRFPIVGIKSDSGKVIAYIPGAPSYVPA